MADLSPPAWTTNGTARCLPIRAGWTPLDQLSHCRDRDRAVRPDRARRLFRSGRGRFIGRDTLRALFMTPMILPVVVLAVALYAFFLKIGLAGTTTGFRHRASGRCLALLDPGADRRTGRF